VLTLIKLIRSEHSTDANGGGWVQPRVWQTDGLTDDTNSYYLGVGPPVRWDRITLFGPLATPLRRD